MGTTSVTMSRPTHFLSEIEADNVPIPPGKLAYFQERLRNRIYHFVLSKFFDAERRGLTKALLARRLGSDPAVISRLLGAPGNWTLDTVSNLLLGIAREELEPASSSVLDRKSRNFAAPEWIAETQAKLSRQVPPPPGPLGESCSASEHLPELPLGKRYAA